MNEKINLSEKLTLLDKPYEPGIVGFINDYKLQVVKVKGPFVWHKHDETDDFFLVISGRLTIHLRDRDIYAAPRRPHPSAADRYRLQADKLDTAEHWRALLRQPTRQLARRPTCSRPKRPFPPSTPKGEADLSARLISPTPVRPSEQLAARLRRGRSDQDPQQKVLW